MKIYLAGKIDKLDWRHEIVEDLRCVDAVTVQGNAHDTMSVYQPWPILENAIFGSHDYAGPFFIGCDHGCYHRNASHGVGLGAWGESHDAHGGCMGDLISRENAVRACKEAIAKSDVVFAWLDSEDAYGTLVEIGMAHALGKQVWIAYSGQLGELWFAGYLADAILLDAPSAKAALEHFLPKPTVAAPSGPTPIVTQYNGFRFRSRLEARWAVFFDALGVKYEYEKEGFDLGKEGWYLPDFWLPECSVWIEIKPKKDGDHKAATDKLAALVYGSPNNGMLICGNPWPGEYQIVDLVGGPMCDIAMPNGEFGECRKCDKLLIGSEDYGYHEVGRHDCNNERWPLFGTASERLMSAYKAARSARFEHGEKG